jgi:Domain of unknown function (DUF4249)
MQYFSINFFSNLTDRLLRDEKIACYMKIFGLLLLVSVGCKEYYTAPALKNAPDFLVVDGNLTGGPDSTYIKLTHARSLMDTAPASPELNALLTVEGDQNTLIPLYEIGNGVYGNRLPLSNTEKYRLNISTSAGPQYRSDFVPYRQTPPIDSINWNQDSAAVNFFVSAHDPQNNTIYYRWQFEETWQYNSFLVANFDYVNDSVVARPPTDQIHNCWKTNLSPTILLGSSEKLSRDIISQFKFLSVSKSTEKIYLLYSVQINQYALTRDQFEYWTELKKSSEQLGSLFDAQPTQLNSNIHNLTNPNEPVLGYLSASSVQKQRIFVSIRDMNNYNYVPYYLPCERLADVSTGFSRFDTRRAYEYLQMPNHLFTFWYTDGDSYIVAQNFCIDCREHGGSNQKPSYWP